MIAVVLVSALCIQKADGNKRVVTMYVIFW